MSSFRYHFNVINKSRDGMLRNAPKRRLQAPKHCRNSRVEDAGQECDMALETCVEAQFGRMVCFVE